MQVVICANQKGGAGKTTTVVNLAATLGLDGARVLIVDADPQGQAGATYGIAVETVTKARSVGMLVLRQASGDIITRDTILSAVYDCSHVFNDLDTQGTIHVLGSENQTMQDANFMLNQKKGDPTSVLSLRSILETVQDDFDFVVIDTPPSVDALAVLCWCAADGIIATAIPESQCLDGTLVMVGVADRVSAITQGARKPRFLGTVITKNLPPSALDPAKKAADTDAINTINGIIFGGGMVFPRDIRKATAIQRQKIMQMPAAISHNAGKPGREYMDLLGQVLERMTSDPATWPTMQPIDLSALFAETAEDDDE